MTSVQGSKASRCDNIVIHGSRPRTRWQMAMQTGWYAHYWPELPGFGTDDRQYPLAKLCSEPISCFTALALHSLPMIELRAWLEGIQISALTPHHSVAAAMIVWSLTKVCLAS